MFNIVIPPQEFILRINYVWKYRNVYDNFVHNGRTENNFNV